MVKQLIIKVAVIKYRENLYRAFLILKNIIILSCEYMILKFESVNNIKYKIFEFNFESIIL